MRPLLAPDVPVAIAFGMVTTPFTGVSWDCAPASCTPAIIPVEATPESVRLPFASRAARFPFVAPLTLSAFAVSDG